MQAVSTAFNTTTAAAYRNPQYGCLISWQKNIAGSFTFFQLDHSHLDRNDKLKGIPSSVAYFDRYDYVNESQYVQSLKISKKVSSRPWGVIMAQATVVLNNASNRFTPGYDVTIGNYILRDRPIKLSVGFGGEFINMFVGYTERPKFSLGNRTVTLECFDAMAYLGKVKSALGTYVNTSVKQIINDLLVEQGFSASMFNLEDSLQQPIGYFNPNGKFVLDMLRDFCDAEGALMFVDENGIIQFWNRLHMSRNQTSLWDFTYSNMKDVQWDQTSVINDVLVTASPLKPAAYNKIFELNGGTDKTLVPPGGSVDIFAAFRDDLGDFPAISVTAPVYVDSAAGSSSYSTNYNKDGTGDTGAAYITLSSTYNFGNTYRMTFANSSAQPIYVTNIQLFGQPAKVTALSTIPQIDSVSIGKYGLNPDDGGNEITFDNDLIQDANTANLLGYLLIKYYSTPLARMMLSNFAVPQAQIGDCVTVHMLDTGVNYTTFVMGYVLSFSQGAKLEQQLYVEQRQLFSYFQLDISHLDRTDRLGA